MSGKKIQDMTEEEILNHVATAIHDYLMRIRPQRGEFILEDCIALQVSELKKLFHNSRGLNWREPLSTQDIQELDLIIAHFLPQMEERARAVQLHYTKEQTLWKIKGTSADALIKKAFQDVGMKAMVECQKYRARVLVVFLCGVQGAGAGRHPAQCNPGDTGPERCTMQDWRRHQTRKIVCSDSQENRSL